MPSAPKRVCPRGHGDYLGRRCPGCNKEYELRRGTARQRGYDVEWERFRKWFLNLHSICEFGDCMEKAVDVHHLKRVREFPQLKFVEENCQALCHSHHSFLTGKEDIGQRKMR